MQRFFVHYDSRRPSLSVAHFAAGAGALHLCLAVSIAQFTFTSVATDEGWWWCCCNVTVAVILLLL
jgi:hypothetical protein